MAATSTSAKRQRHHRLRLVPRRGRKLTAAAYERAMRMASHGFSLRAIVGMIWRQDRIRITTGGISYVLHCEGVSIRDYRNGKTTTAKIRMAEIGVSQKRISLTGT